MVRLATSLAVLVACMGMPAVAADWADDWGSEVDFRAGYSNEPKDWSGVGETDDSLHFEAGLRYWYSMGRQSFEALGDSFEGNDTTHSGELHLRIDDYASATYVKGLAGYSAAITGSFTDPSATDASIDGGKVAYAGADFGWNVFSDGNGSGAGFLLGYQYWNDSPRTSRQNFTTAHSAADLSFDSDTGEVFLPFDSVDNNIDVHMLRLGLSGKGKLGDMFDISGEIAAVPYASISGTIGNSGFDPLRLTDLGNYSFVKSSATEINGSGYGAMAEAMIGVTPIENLTLRFGGRAWYLQGTADATYSAITLGDPTDSDPANPPAYDTPPTVSEQGYIDLDNPWSLFRYGILAELTYAF